MNWLRVALAATFLTAAWGQELPDLKTWKGKTVLLIGAHPDDDTYAHGTLAMLRAQGNDIWIALLTSGNVGTQDPDLSMMELAEIRRQEELQALKAIGVPADRYINLGYDDGMLEFADRQEVVADLVRLIRKIRPEVLFAFDPGRGYQRWLKSDHRTAAYLAADAARAAMWRLLFQGQVVHEGLKEHRISEYIFFDSVDEDRNLWVDISGFEDEKINAGMSYVSQWGPGWEKYKGPELSAEEEKAMRERVSRRVQHRNGKPVEGFRYYRGLPDGIGR